jgi:cytochrome c biogenesis protein CcdA/thiol-disulfide isomerase/thioredoxin
MELFLIAFFAGMLTVLTPCVLPVLPVILSGSLAGTERLRPLIITGSLIVSVFLFTLLLKASAALINIPPQTWTYLAGGIVLLFGLTLMFPNQWFYLSEKLGFEKSQQLIQSASQTGGTKGMVFLGMALGPVFASCSPTYALILAVVLPQDFVMGISALVVYCLGLFVPLFLIAYGGRSVLGGFRWFANPQSKFRKGLGVVLVVVGLLILTGYEKKLEAALLDNGYFDFTKLEQGLVQNYDMEEGEEKKIMDMAKKQEAKMGTPSLPKSDDPTEALLNENYPAPELVEPQNWINSVPLTLAKLREEGKVVMIDFWTYSCINCIRTLPALKALDAEYRDKGLVILGVHSPEFAFEKVLSNLQENVTKFELKYPIFQDNDFKTWRAYKNRFWPAKYIIDKQGNVRYTHFGEGEYEETEQVIQYLLGEVPLGSARGDKSKIDFSMVEEAESGVSTRETYLGTDRMVVGSGLEMFGQGAAAFVSPETVSEQSKTYTKPQMVEKNQWWLTGGWQFSEEKITSTSEEASLGLRYTAKQANLVIGFTGEPVGLEVWLDGKLIDSANAGRMLKDGKVMINANQLYYLTEHKGVEDHTVELKFKGKGLELYAWTFG